MKWHTNYFYMALLVWLMLSLGYLKGDSSINICLPGLAYRPIPALSQFVKKNKKLKACRAKHTQCTDASK